MALERAIGLISDSISKNVPPHEILQIVLQDVVTQEAAPNKQRLFTQATPSQHDIAGKMLALLLNPKKEFPLHEALSAYQHALQQKWLEDDSSLVIVMNLFFDFYPQEKVAFAAQNDAEFSDTILLPTSVWSVHKDKKMANAEGYAKYHHLLQPQSHKKAIYSLTLALETMHFIEHYPETIAALIHLATLNPTENRDLIAKELISYSSSRFHTFLHHNPGPYFDYTLLLAIKDFAPYFPEKFHAEMVKLLLSLVLESHGFNRAMRHYAYDALQAIAKKLSPTALNDLFLTLKNRLAASEPYIQKRALRILIVLHSELHSLYDEKLFLQMSAISARSKKEKHTNRIFLLATDPHLVSNKELTHLIDPLFTSLENLSIQRHLIGKALKLKNLSGWQLQKRSKNTHQKNYQAYEKEAENLKNEGLVKLKKKLMAYENAKHPAIAGFPLTSTINILNISNADLFAALHQYTKTITQAIQNMQVIKNRISDTAFLHFLLHAYSELKKISSLEKEYAPGDHCEAAQAQVPLLDLFAKHFPFEKNMRIYFRLLLSFTFSATYGLFDYEKKKIYTAIAKTVDGLTPANKQTFVTHLFQKTDHLNSMPGKNKLGTKEMTMIFVAQPSLLEYTPAEFIPLICGKFYNLRTDDAILLAGIMPILSEKAQKLYSQQIFAAICDDPDSLKSPELAPILIRHEPQDKLFAFIHNQFKIMCDNFNNARIKSHNAYCYILAMVPLLDATHRIALLSECLIAKNPWASDLYLEIYDHHFKLSEQQEKICKPVFARLC